MAAGGSKSCQSSKSIHGMQVMEEIRLEPYVPFIAGTRQKRLQFEIDM
jgi:hypothetical protein